MIGTKENENNRTQCSELTAYLCSIIYTLPPFPGQQFALVYQPISIYTGEMFYLIIGTYHSNVSFTLFHCFSALVDTYVCTYVRTHTHTHTYIHTYDVRTYMYVCMHTYIHTYIHTDRQTDRQTDKQRGSKTISHSFHPYKATYR